MKSVSGEVERPQILLSCQFSPALFECEEKSVVLFRCYVVLQLADKIFSLSPALMLQYGASLYIMHRLEE